MASTNEDAVLLATRPRDDGRLLIMRHLPDRGTIEIGWWARDENGAVGQGAPVLELAAEAVEESAVGGLWELAGCGMCCAERGGTTRLSTAGWSPRLLPPPTVPRSWPCAPGAT